MSQEALDRPEYRPEASAIELSLKDEDFNRQPLTTPNAITEAVDIAIEESEHAFDAAHLGLPPLVFSEISQAVASDTPKIAIATLSDKLNLSQTPPETQSVQQDKEQVSSFSSVQAQDLALSKVLESRTLYQTCRIKVPHLERRLFAILVEGQYYSFSRAEETKEHVLEIMARLGDQLEKTVITKTEKGYAIWDLEPEVSSTIS
jgi:hypothetical protein